MNRQDKQRLLHQALDMHRAGNISEADKIYLSILKNDENDFDANHLHGLVLGQRKFHQQAIVYYDRAYSQIKNNIELLNNYAISLRKLFNYQKCEELLLEAIGIDNTYENSYINLSNCYATQGKYNESIEVLNNLRERGHNSNDITKRLINLYTSKYIQKKNKSDLNKCVELLDEFRFEDTKDFSLINICACAYLWANRLESSLKLFKLSSDLASQPPTLDTLRNLDNKIILKNFVRHEYEQITHVDSDEDGIRNVKISQDFYNQLKLLNNKQIKSYSDEDLFFISKLHKIIYNKPPKPRDKYLNELLDIAAIENEYNNSNPEIVVIDNFLSQEFLKDLNIFFRCANIFKYPYPRGYIGTFLGKGMANKAILEFSQDLKHSFPNIFKDYNLTQAWAFKYDSNLDGIGIHADDAKVNVNFWITNEDSNLDKDSGGMIVWKKKPDLDKGFKDFNSIENMNKMLEEVRDIDYIRVPYKQNRVVIFNSKLYHVTDKLDFKPGYKNRRINVTYLYQ